MSLLNPLFCILIYAIAFFTAYLIQLKYKLHTAPARYESIDGLRGFLALGVFIHHTAIWQVYISTDKWTLPESNLYTQLGQSTVGLFFMITSFLFVTQLLKARETSYDWKAFAVSRLFRIFPLYYVVILTTFILVFAVSAWNINVSYGELGSQLKDWLLFTITDSPDINGLKNTKILGGGVAWSLAYEWLFYFALPIIAIFILKKPKKLWLIAISLVFIVGFFLLRGKLSTDSFLFYFAGGVVPALLNKYSTLQRKINKHLLSVVVIICVGLLFREQYAQNLYCLVLNTVIFTIIATGNSVFGILKKPFLRLLGDISYSTYLLHLLLLFVIFYSIIGLDTVRTFSEPNYILLIFFITPIVVIISFLSYRFIEQPFMAMGKKIMGKKK